MLIFHMFVSYLYVFFGEMYVQVFCPLFDWVVFLVLGCMSCLYTLEINPLSIGSFAIIFSQSEGCLFTLLIVSFAVEKLLSLIRSHLFIFVFYFHYSRRWVIKDLPLIYVIEGSACFPLRVHSFWLTFRSLIHFEFIFVYGVRKCSNVILVHVAVQFSQHHLLKRLSLSHCIFCLLCQNYSTHWCMGLFLGFLSCSIGLCFCFCANTMLS